MFTNLKDSGQDKQIWQKSMFVIDWRPKGSPIDDEMYVAIKFDWCGWTCFDWKIYIGLECMEMFKSFKI